MDEYLKSMENYSPNAAGTSHMMGETEIKEISGTPSTTATNEEETNDEAPYMIPQTILVRRYTLKK